MNDLAQRIKAKIAEIPAHNPSVMALYQETLSSVLSDAMLRKIAEVAAEEATIVSCPSPLGVAGADVSNVKP